MPKLILSMDGLVLKEMLLEKERITIGRKPMNDIQIDNLAISGQHAIITTIGNDAFLEDRNSTNGTYVNGQPIKKYVLQSNDVIELGKYRLRYLTEVSKAGSSSELLETQVLPPLEMTQEPGDEVKAAQELIAPEAPPLPPPSLAPAPVPTPVAPMVGEDVTCIDPAATQLLSDELREAAIKTSLGSAGVDARTGVIQILSGSNSGRELSLVKSLTTLGKPGKQVAVITRRPHGYFITHVEGNTFPLINGKPLDAQAYRLGEHDIIDIAGVKMEFFLR